MSALGRCGRARHPTRKDALASVPFFPELSAGAPYPELAQHSMPKGGQFENVQAVRSSEVEDTQPAQYSQAVVERGLQR